MQRLQPWLPGYWSVNRRLRYHASDKVLGLVFYSRLSHNGYGLYHNTLGLSYRATGGLLARQSPDAQQDSPLATVC